MNGILERISKEVLPFYFFARTEEKDKTARIFSVTTQF
jgi:hypothetical protein